jgi:hypothetical protein
MTGDEVTSTGTNVFVEPHYVWLFQCSSRTRLHVATLDRTAKNLPEKVCRDGEWTLSGQLIVGPATGNSAGIDLHALMAGIRKDGYYLWNADEEELPDGLRLTR